eukprot:5025520-Amphidinium_carterae.1
MFHRAKQASMLTFQSRLDLLSNLMCVVSDRNMTNLHNLRPESPNIPMTHLPSRLRREGDAKFRLILGDGAPSDAPRRRT